MKSVYTFIILMCCLTGLTSQESRQWHVRIPWEKSRDIALSKGQLTETHPFLPGVPVYILEESVSPGQVHSAEIQPLVTERITLPDSLAKRVTNLDFLQSVSLCENRLVAVLRTTLLPLRKHPDGGFEKLITATFQCIIDPATNSSARTIQSFESVLAKGAAYKIAVTQTGVHKLDKAFLEKIGIVTAGLNPKQLRIFGGRGGRLPEANTAPRQDDLIELAISVIGEDDERFDAGDVVVFYAEGADIWNYNASKSRYSFDKNVYEQSNYYFIVINGENGLRISQTDSPQGIPDIVVPFYDRIQRLEEDKVNLLGSFIGAEGTGKEWYGDYFSSSLKEKNLSARFDVSGLVPGEPVDLDFIFAARSRTSSSLSLALGSKNINASFSSVSTTDVESQYARKAVYSETFVPSGPISDIKLTYPVSGSDAEGWLDYLQLVTAQKLTLTNGQLSFRNRKTIQASLAAFTLDNATDQEIWDVTDPFRPIRQKRNGQQLVFRPQGTLREFVSFAGVTSAYDPTAVGKIPNQNLHGITDADMLIVYHPLFATAARKLAEHRESHSGIKVTAAETTAVFNEFSSGKADPVAIRDFARMLYLRNPDFRYLLLFGDGTYDYRGIVKDIPAENFVPTYQTDESLHPIDGFPSDDFFGLLGTSEGVQLKGNLDIYIGRLPARTATDATIYVDKIIHYDTAPECRGDWRLRSSYIADDEDGNTHLRDMDDIARLDEIRHPSVNQQKIYADAYKQISTPGENRYPDANKTIFESIFKGVLTMTYLGHGGPLGWAQERILTVPELQSWTNRDQLPVMITATCSFGAFDEPAVISPAEYALGNPNGGAIALMTTTRAVYTNSNKQLTDAVHEVLLSKIDGRSPTLGYTMAQGKNKYKNDFFVNNSRKFSLLGDPSVSIALPALDVVTSSVNGADASAQSDTLHALEKVEIEGYIANADGSVATAFQGTLFPTVYDKKVRQQTLANDPSSSRYDFTLYRNILFKGAATITNGKWKFSFWVPKNINYTIGKGRISYYATNGADLDASGFYNELVLGGSSDNPAMDNEGPEMKLYMNDYAFKNGGITDANPILLMALEDDLGIDVTGNAIGQDITAILDGDSRNQFILNSFYEAQRDDYRKGLVRFPLSRLSPGAHYIETRAWDISGNATSGRLDFIVAEPDNNSLFHVAGYPNPFTDQVSLQFEHDLAGQGLAIRVQLYDAAGRLVKNNEIAQYSEGFRVNDIIWDGRESFEEELARGVYFCKIIVETQDGLKRRESKMLKLVKI